MPYFLPDLLSKADSQQLSIYFLDNEKLFETLRPLEVGARPDQVSLRLMDAMYSAHVKNMFELLLIKSALFNFEVRFAAVPENFKFAKSETDFDRGTILDLYRSSFATTKNTIEGPRGKDGIWQPVDTSLIGWAEDLFD
ncbi:MAG: hypothetical protein AAGG56_07525 [Pseudomonadota bacterium]